MALNGDLAEELILWAEEYGTLTTAKSGALYSKFNYKNGERARDLVELIQKLKDLGAEKGMFKGGPTKDAIISTCIPPKHCFDTPKKYGRACVCVAKEIDSAVLKVFGSESEYYKKNGQTRQLVSEQSELVKQALEEEAQKTAGEAIAEVIAETSTPSEYDELPPGEAYPPPPPKRKWKDVEKELIAAGKLVEDNTSYSIDPEILAEFGIKK